MADAGPTVSLRLISLAENLTLVRGLLSGLGDALGMDPELLDDVKTAISEAANNVVMHAYGEQTGSLEIELSATSEGVEAVVRDEGDGIPELALAGDQIQGVGLPVIEALSEEADIRTRGSGGTEVVMRFPASREGRALFGVPATGTPPDAWMDARDGDAVVSLSPVTLLPAILGRLSRALAATARFSLDRFSDVYLVTDALSAFAARAASNQRVGFALLAAPRRLELTLGPLRRGSADLLLAQRGTAHASPLIMLTDELRGDPEGSDGERLTVVMVDHRR